MRTDLYQNVTDQIVAALEQGVRPWQKPWSASAATGRIVLPLRGNGVPYRGINILMLWGAAIDNGFRSPTWLTYKQASELGGQVRKGEKGSLVVYASSMTRTETMATLARRASAIFLSLRVTPSSTRSRSTGYRIATGHCLRHVRRRSSATPLSTSS